MDSLQGSLLVAAPALVDPNFHRTVVLIVQHSAEGALGLVLNRPSGVTVRQVVTKVTGSPCRCSEKLYIGGPCEGPLMAVHTNRSICEIEVTPGVYFSGSPETLKDIVDSDQQPLRMFGGYAGWGAGQLEAELELDSWLTMHASPYHIFGGDEELWQSLSAGLSLLAELNIGPVPADPSLN